jgi:ribosomal protein S18 acetylase RimI-like enzyme
LDPQPLTSAHKESWLGWLADASHAHRHVGWLPAAYWLGKPSSLLLPDSGGNITACLLACPDLLGTAWIHVFASDSPPGVVIAWEQMWPVARRELQALGIGTLWAMSTQSWFSGLLESSGFMPHGQVVALAMRSRHILEETGPIQRIRTMKEADLDHLLQLDQEAFRPPWQLDRPAFEETFRRAALATVLVSGMGEPIGYQLSIPTAQGIHLARLAVLPRYQGLGYGRTLTVHLINYFQRRKAPLITLNTQSDNARSFRLYHAVGFHESGETYPCYRYPLALS